MTGGRPSARIGGQTPKRLGINRQGYQGKGIDIDEVLAGCVEAAHNHGWRVEHLAAGPDLELIALSRPAATAGGLVRRIYLSTGIHGDEPAGPLAMRRLLQENQWPASAELYACPCLNPGGFRLGRRENREGLDLNRQYLRPEAGETRAHIAWLDRQPPFDFCVCLHEDWESAGFYIYELNAAQARSPAEGMIRDVAPVCPVDPSEMIEGRPAVNGVIRPNLDPRTRPQWPEAFYLVTHKTGLSCTLEAPSDFPLAARVEALVVAARSGIAFVCVESSGQAGPGDQEATRAR